MYGTSNERLVYDQAYTFWPMMVLFVGVMIFGNLLCWLLIRRRESACSAVAAGMVVTMLGMGNTPMSTSVLSYEPCSISHVVAVADQPPEGRVVHRRIT